MLAFLLKRNHFLWLVFDLGEYPDTLSNLIASTTYYVRAYAINCAGVAYGDEKVFTSLHGKPKIITLPVTDITSTAAVSGGDILSDGGAPILRRGICWSDKGDPMKDPLSLYTNDGSGVGEYPSDMTYLLGSTTYYVRAYADNKYGKIVWKS